MRLRGELLNHQHPESSLTVSEFVARLSKLSSRGLRLLPRVLVFFLGAALYAAIVAAAGSLLWHAPFLRSVVFVFKATMLMFLFWALHRIVTR